MRTSGAAETANPRIPDTKDNHIRGILSTRKERMKHMEKVQQLHDDQRKARGYGYDQHANAPNIDPATRQRFTELADQWEYETVFLSSTSQAIKHPAHRKIVDMGETAVPLIMERMRKKGGHWFIALREITGANPIPYAKRGNVPAMQEAWLQWGEANGYA